MMTFVSFIPVLVSDRFLDAAAKIYQMRQGTRRRCPLTAGISRTLTPTSSKQIAQIMRFSKGFLPTVKEVPADAVIPSHQLMLRAGLMRPLGAGIYSYLPLGYAVMKKIIEIVREEMDAIGGQEFLLPALNPIELWEETGRVQAFGDTMFHVKNRPLVLAPTHEEVITSIARNHVKWYKDLPQIWYRFKPNSVMSQGRNREFCADDSS